MSHLRAHAESQVYSSMLPPSSASNPFSLSNPKSRNTPYTIDDDSDNIQHQDSSRQVTLIFNILVSILCTFFALFFVSRNWSGATRVSLALFGSLAVGGAEVGVYWGYLHRLKEAKRKELETKEVKQLVDGESWVIEARKDGGKENVKRRKVKEKAETD
jgi:Endoplasmic reticulum-based factor for assembly of V-ATPase